MKQQIVIIANGAPYGTESLFNALRLGIALNEQEGVILKIFLMSDAVGAALTEEMRRDHSVLVFGEGIATKRHDLVQEFGARRARHEDRQRDGDHAAGQCACFLMLDPGQLNIAR